ncbi:hypothetical protein VIB_002715 [Vibrio metschnikovii CIP 69.14]|nr:hypothetical protein VIB_002715 [Vibrio metschnikovii CIP 69.14]
MRQSNRAALIVDKKNNVKKSQPQKGAIGYILCEQRGSLTTSVG